MQPIGSVDVLSRLIFSQDIHDKTGKRLGLVLFHEHDFGSCKDPMGNIEDLVGFSADFINYETGILYEDVSKSFLKTYYKYVEGRRDRRRFWGGMRQIK